MKRIAVIALLVAGTLGAQTKTEAQPPAAGAPAIPSYKELKYPPLRAIHIPDVATFTLPNGLRLYLVENHELPLVRQDRRSARRATGEYRGIGGSFD
jgi:hypothetical protein